MPHPEELARELAGVITERKLEAGLLGGTAIHLTCPSARALPLSRAYGDLDAAVTRRGAAAFQRAVEEAGWTPDRQFNTVYGQKRLLYRRDGLDLDVFVSVFEQCHQLNLETDLRRPEPTLSHAFLLLTKLQVVEINQKDLTDSLAILLDHPPGGGGLDLADLTAVTARDWGWHTTVGDNLERLEGTARAVLDEAEMGRALARIEAVRSAMAQAPKAMGWKLREKIGRRVQWYVLPEAK